MSKVFSVKRNLLSTTIPFLRQYVTVIGSAQLDIFGEFDSSAEQQIDKRGKIFYSVGGGAYNVAANLTQYNHWVYLCTGLARNSYISGLLREKIKKNHISTKFVDFCDDIGESGFVAHRNTQTHSLSTAVSCMAVESISFDSDKLKKAIEKSRLVIVDCNLSDSTLQQVIDIAAKESPPIQVMVTGISESKIKRVRQVDRDAAPAFDVIVAHVEDAFEGLCKNGHQNKNFIIENITIAVSETMDASSLYSDGMADNSSNKSHEATLAEDKRKKARDFFKRIASGQSVNNYSVSTICKEAKTRFLIITDGIKGEYCYLKL
ncbi:MAG: hypothetical protein RLZZ419_1814 [Pseudomonadota bacterium]